MFFVGIENLKFDLAYNVSLLNSWGVTPLELSGYIKVSPLPVLCSADSLTRSGDVATTTASPSQVSTVVLSQNRICSKISIVTLYLKSKLNEQEVI